MNKIVIIGSPGAGKSTFAKQLGERLQLPVIHLDYHYWGPGWIKAPIDEWDQMMKRFVSGERWIIDGNYGRTMDVRLEAADTIIYLDFPRMTCFLGVIKRRIQNHGATRPDMGPGCPERLDWNFLPYVWTFPDKKRPGILKRLEHFSEGREIIILRKRSDVKNLLEDLDHGRVPYGINSGRS